MTKVLHKLEQVLIDSYALLIKTQNYHWNIRGNNFSALHKLLDDQYGELVEAVDGIAECIRAIGAPVVANLAHFAQMTKIKNGDHNFSSQHMLSDLADSHELLMAEITEALLAAREAGDYVSEDIMVDRLRWHKKALWMVVSNIQ